MKKLLACICLCFCLPALCHAADLPAISQQQLSTLIKENSGKVILLNFFATWCPPCKVEMPELVKLRETFPKDQLLVIGMSVDEEKDAVPAFLEKVGVNYPVYMAAKDVTAAYDINSVPHNAFFDPAGKLVISEPGLADLDLLKETINTLLGKKGN